MMRRILGAALALMMLLSLSPVDALAQEIQEQESGGEIADTMAAEELSETVKSTAGWGYSYSYDTGILTVSGSGAMPDYEFEYVAGNNKTKAPWADCGSVAKTIYLDNGITSVGKNAFYGFSCVTSIRFPGNLTAIGESAFSNCPKLSSVNLPSGLKTIGPYAFVLTGLTELTVLNTIESIGYNAFAGCSKLTEVTLQKGAIWSSDFVGDNTALLRYVVDEDDPNYKVVDGMLLDKAGKTLLCYPGGKGTTRTVLPDTIEIIGYVAFNSFTNGSADYLYDVVLPSSLKTISDYGLIDSDDNRTKPYFHYCGSKADFSSKVTISGRSSYVWNDQETAGYIHYMTHVPGTAATTSSKGTSDGWYCATCGETIIPNTSCAALFSGGDGTQATPYQISTAAQLDSIRYDLSASYILTADITFAASDFASGGTYYNEGKGWQSIGTNEVPFCGTLDGAGHAITGLQGSCGGLFGYNEGTIQNLRLLNHKLFNSIGSYSGAVVNVNQRSGTVTRCYVCSGYTNDTIPTSYEIQYVGGVAGYNLGAVTYCRNGGVVGGKCSYVNGQFAVGGITGNGNVWYCINDGVVIAGSTVTLSYGRVEGIAGAGNTYDCRDNGSVKKSYTANYSYFPGIYTSTRCVSGKTSLLESGYAKEYNFSTVWMILPEGATPQGVIDAEGKWYTRKSYQAPTCESTGATELLDNAGKSSSVTLAKLPHTLVKKDAVAVSYVSDGCEQHWICSVCHKYFSDVQGTQETDLASVTIPALGVTISGSVSSLMTGTITAKLLHGETLIGSATVSDASFSIVPDANDPAKRAVVGSYRLLLEADGGVTWEETVVIASDTDAVYSTSCMMVKQGDLNGDGIGSGSSQPTLEVLDLASLYDYLSKSDRPLSFCSGVLSLDKALEKYFIKVADVNGDGGVNILDYQSLYERL